VSLILEALKKLEREKQAPDRGFLVVAHVPWPAGPAARSLWLVAGLALGLIGLLALLLLRGRDTPPTIAKAPQAVPTPVGTPLALSPSLPAWSAPPQPAPTSPAPSRVAPHGAAAPKVAPSRDHAPLPSAPGREPTATPSPSPAVAGDVDVRLNAITQQDGQPVAVLNDRVVREGDVFDGIHVIRIGEAEVEVEVNGKRRVVRF
jgi:hypothetical protein